MNSDEPEDLEKSLNAFKKCGNTDMCYSIAYKLECDKEQITLLTKDLIEVLATSHRHSDAANLLVSVEGYDIAQAVEYYSKGNSFMAAIRESMKEQDEDENEKLLNITKNGISLAYDVKKNQILKILEEFDKRYLRLKIVQHNKRNMPSQLGAMG